jgi:threonylcarbamoyladenosine tRNA methylthiotransferase MtaB
MPQVDGAAIKDRARRLREGGAEAVSRHLDAQLGRMHAVLMENPRMGRTEQFTEVTFDTDQPEGQIVRARITGRSGTQLRAVPA